MWITLYRAYIWTISFSPILCYNKSMESELLTNKEACNYLGISTTTMRRWEARGWVRPIRPFWMAWKRYKRSTIEAIKEVRDSKSNTYWYKDYAESPRSKHD